MFVVKRVRIIFLIKKVKTQIHMWVKNPLYVKLYTSKCADNLVREGSLK
jgi:hypothetical protein